MAKQLLSKELDGVLGAAARVFAMRGHRELVSILAHSQARLVETNFDNWNGGTWTYRLELTTPVSTFLSIGELEKTQKAILDGIAPMLQRYDNEGIENVLILLEPHNDIRWRERAKEWLSKRQRSQIVSRWEYDVFVCHASEDKGVAGPLAESLRRSNARVWYDEFVLRVGDSLRAKIDHGLTKSKFGIVVFSPSFFAKSWPQYELDGLASRELEGRKVILPLWHHVTKEVVAQHSPSLSMKLALNTSTESIDSLAAQFLEVILES